MPPAPEQQPPVIPAEQTTARNGLVKWFFVVGILAIVIIAVGAMFFWQYDILGHGKSAPNIGTSTQSSGELSTTTDASLWIFPKWNFSLKRNPDWTLFQPSEFGTLPFASSTAANAVFALKKGQCEIVFLPPDESRFIQTLQYLGTPQNIPPYPASTKFNVGYAMEQSRLPSGFSYNSNSVQHLPGELFVVDVADRNLIRQSIDGDPLFVLFNTEGGLIDPGCATDTLAITATLAPYYETAKLNVDSYGVLYLRNGNLLFVDGTGIPKDTHKNITDAYMQGGVKSNYVPVPLVYDNGIFYPSGNTYRKLDPFTGQETSYPVPSVTDALPVGDNLYLIGSPSNIATTSTYTLYRLSLSAGLVTTLGEVHTARFAGYSQKTNILYFLDGTEGQGCFSYSYEQFDINSGKDTSLGNFSACNGDPNYAKSEAQAQAIESNFDKQYALSSGGFALVKGGQITQAVGNENKKWASLIEWQASAWHFASSTSGQ